MWLLSYAPPVCSHSHCPPSPPLLDADRRVEPDSGTTRTRTLQSAVNPLFTTGGAGDGPANVLHQEPRPVRPPNAAAKVRPARPPSQGSRTLRPKRPPSQGIATMNRDIARRSHDGPATPTATTASADYLPLESTQVGTYDAASDAPALYEIMEETSGIAAGITSTPTTPTTATARDDYLPLESTQTGTYGAATNAPTLYEVMEDTSGETVSQQQQQQPQPGFIRLDRPHEAATETDTDGVLTAADNDYGTTTDVGVVGSTYESADNTTLPSFRRQPKQTNLLDVNAGGSAEVRGVATPPNYDHVAQQQINRAQQAMNIGTYERVTDGGLPARTS